MMRVLLMLAILILPPVASAQKSWEAPAITAAIVSVNAADYMTTKTILRMGGREGNPFLRGPFKHEPAGSLAMGGLTALQVVAMNKVLREPRGGRTIAWIVTGASVAVRVFVVRHNLSVIDKLNRRNLQR